MITMKGLIFTTINILFLTLVSAYSDLSVSEVKELEVGYSLFVYNFFFEIFINKLNINCDYNIVVIVFLEIIVLFSHTKSGSLHLVCTLNKYTIK